MASGKNMKVVADYHMHTKASDGKHSVEQLQDCAHKRGILQIAVTDHSFASTIFHMTCKKLDSQQAVIAECNQNAQSDGKNGVMVLSGIEANLTNAQGDIDIPCDVISRLDVLIIGFHRFIGFKGEKRGGYDRKWLFANGFCSKATRQKLVEKNTQAYINAMRKFPIDVIAHLNHRALVDVKRVCDEACKRGVYIELNEKHIDTLVGCVEDMLNSGVNFIVGTDAHSANKVGKMDRILNFVEVNNIPLERVYGIDDRLPKFKGKGLV